MPARVAAGQSPVLSPTGERIAFLADFDGRAYQVKVWQAGGTVRTLQHRGSGPVWSPDGRWLAYRTAPAAPGEDMSMILVDTTTWVSRSLGNVYSCSCDISYGPFWSPDSRELIYRFAAEKTSFAVAPGSGARTPVQASNQRVFRWSPDSKALLTEGDKALLLNDMEAATSRALVQGVNIATASWSPDGSKVSYEWSDGTEWKVSVRSREGAEMMTVTGGPGGVIWSADSVFVAVEGPEGIGIYRPETGAREHMLAGAAMPAWSSVGLEVAYVRPLPGDGCRANPGLGPLTGRRLWDIDLFDMAAGRERRLASLATGCPGDTPVITWSPDGRFIALCDTPGLGLCSSEANERGGRVVHLPRPSRPDQSKVSFVWGFLNLTNVAPR